MDLEGLTLDMLEAVEERDGQRLAALHHPHIRFVWPPRLPEIGGVHRGSEEVLPMYARWASLWDPLQPTRAERAMSPEIVAASADHVVARFTQRGVDPSARRTETEVLAVYRWEDSLVRDLHMYMDDPQALADFLAQAHTW